MWISDFRNWIVDECIQLKNEGKEDIECLWNLLDNDESRFKYCRFVEDKKEVWQKIESSRFCYFYCKSYEH